MIGNASYLLETTLTRYDNLEFALRIVLAAVLGMLVGMERSRRLKGAGVRTHCIVAMTASVFMILSKYAFQDLVIGETPGIRGADAARIAAQVVSGSSFLGAGIIFKQGRNSIHGLTTAAGMWATAAVGMAIGAGMYWVGITETILLLLLQILLHRHPFDNDVMTEQKLELRFHGPACTDEVLQLLAGHASIIDSSSLRKDTETVILTITSRAHNPLTLEEVLEFSKEHPEIVGLQLQDT